MIVGLTKRSEEPVVKRLFTYDDRNGDPVESAHTVLTPYLFDGSQLSDRHLVVEERNRPLSDAPSMVIGSKPIDDGHYIFNRDERDSFLLEEPEAESYLHPFVGTTEFLYDTERWIFLLQNVPPNQLRSMPMVMERIAAVRRYRERSSSASTQQLAATPTRFHVTVVPKRSFLVVPEVSSEQRQYVPIGWLDPPVVPSNLVRVVVDARLWHFGVMTSRMHMSWMRHIGGRLESRYRYSIGVVYNTFPWPDVSAVQKERIERLAQSVLDARAQFPEASLADLYDGDVMQPQLVRAHRALDQAVDKLYRAAAFSSDRERVEHLFGLYERLVRPPIAPEVQETQKRQRRRRAPPSPGASNGSGG